MRFDEIAQRISVDTEGLNASKCFRFKMKTY